MKKKIKKNIVTQSMPNIWCANYRASFTKTNSFTNHIQMQKKNIWTIKT